MKNAYLFLLDFDNKTTTLWHSGDEMSEEEKMDNINMSRQATEDTFA